MPPRRGKAVLEVLRDAEKDRLEARIVVAQNAGNQESVGRGSRARPKPCEVLVCVALGSIENRKVLDDVLLEGGDSRINAHGATGPGSE